MTMPRIAELPPSLDQRQREIHDRIASGPRGRVRGPLAMWLYSPDIAERAQHLGEFLRYGSAFGPRLSELVILCVAAHEKCGFEWHVHAPIAEKNGLSRVAIEAIREDLEPVFEVEDERLIHAFCTSLLRRHKVEQATFDAFRDRYGERGVVEITAIMGYYQIGAHLLNAVEFDPPEISQPFAR